MKLKTKLLIAMGLIIQLHLFSQIESQKDEFTDCEYVEDEVVHNKSSCSEIQFSVKSFPVFEKIGIDADARYVNIEVYSDCEIDSIKYIGTEWSDLSSINISMFDDGLNGDDIEDDNIYTTPIQIQQSRSQEPSGNLSFHSFSNYVRFYFYLSDGSIKKYKVFNRAYYFYEEEYNQIQDYIESNQITEVNDSIFYSSNIVHIASKQKNYSSNNIDYSISHFNNIDELIGANFDDNDIMIYYSHLDIDKEISSSGGNYSNGANVIRAKAVRYSLFHHETLHEWVNSFLDYELYPHNGHWGFIVRPSSAFSPKCYSGVFQDLFIDPSNDEVKGVSDQTAFDFSNLELFLMNRLPIDSVSFPIKVLTGQDLECSFGYIENGIIDSLTKDEFIANYETNLEQYTIEDFGDTINYKTVLLYDDRLSNEEILFYSYLMNKYQAFFAKSTRNHCFANTYIFGDSDSDGFPSDLDCDDTDPNVNPDQLEVPYNNIDDDCDEETLDDDLDQDGFLLADDCDDNNPSINPDQIEEPYNNIDEDCDEATLDDDLDEDGFLLAEDCDDNNPNINPDADEIANNGIDEDCDGMDLVTSTHELSNSEIKIYPNPVVDVIYFEVTGELNYSVSLIDLNGKLIFRSNNNKSINVSSIVHGAYFLEFRDLKTGQRVVEKIIVTN